MTRNCPGNFSSVTISNSEEESNSDSDIDSDEDSSMMEIFKPPLFDETIEYLEGSEEQESDEAS